MGYFENQQGTLTYEAEGDLPYAFSWSALPTGNYAIYGLPIFPASFAKGYPYEEGWLQRAIQTAQFRRLSGHYAPAHLEHTDPFGLRPSPPGAGYLDNYRIAPCLVEGQQVPTIYADLLEVPPVVFERIQRRQLRYRSVEVHDPRFPEINSLALMESDVPHHRLPMTIVRGRFAQRFLFRAREVYMTDPTPAAGTTAPPAEVKPEPVLKPEPTVQFGAQFNGPPQPQMGGMGQPMPQMGGGGCPICQQIKQLLMGSGGPPPHQMGANPLQQSAVPQLPPTARFSASEEQLAVMAKMAAQASVAEVQAQSLTKDQIVDRAVQRFRASNRCFSEQRFRAAITDLKLDDPAMIELFAKHFEAHLPVAPVGSMAVPVTTQPQVSQFASEKTLEPFAGEAEDVKKQALQALQDHRGNASLRRVFDDERGYVEAMVGNYKRNKVAEAAARR